MRTPGGSTPTIPPSAWSSGSSRWPTPPPAVSSTCCGALDGLGGLAPMLLGGDLDGRWSAHPTSLISRLDGEADITPSDPEAWARELGSALAVVHAVPSDRLADLPSVLDGRGSQPELKGPLATEVGSRWAEIIGSPEVLTHSDYWSGNVVWRDGRLTGIVDWSGAARGPRGFDVGWCRLDLVLLFDERIADVFLAAYEAADRPRPRRRGSLGRLGRRSLARRSRDLGSRTTHLWGARSHRTRTSSTPLTLDYAHPRADLARRLVTAGLLSLFPFVGEALAQALVPRVPQVVRAPCGRAA